MKARIASVLATVAVALALAPPSGAQAPAAAPAPAAANAPAFTQEQLDSLVAPIALYPDKILVQVLMAATYPLDVVEAARFVKANRDKLKGDAMLKAAEEKNWDPSVQSLTAYGQVLEMMNDKLEWMQQLGDAVLADQKAVMATAQKLRQKAQDAGNLKSNEQQKVVVQQDKTIIIEPAQPQTVYIPTYNPTVVYGSWWAPAYPPYYYAPPPYYYPGYVAGAAMVGFGVGLAVGAAWGWAGANWGGGDIDIDVNNNFTRNKTEFSNRSREGGNKFNHNPSQRKNVGYRDQGTRNKYGAGGDRGGAASRNDYRGRDGGAGAGNRASQGGLDRGGAGGIDRGSGPSAGVADRAGGAGNRAGAGAGGGGFDRGGGAGGGISAGSPANRAGGGGQNFGGSSNFGGSGSFNSGQSRSQASSYSNRGASSRASMGGGGGGGARAGGGGGGGRGGGGGGRGGGRR